MMSIVHPRRRIWVYCALLTLLVVFKSYAGCDMIEREGKPQIRVSEDKATVVFYKDVIVGGFMTWNIYLDSLLIGQSNWRSFFVTELAPGEHYLSSELNKRGSVFGCKQHTVKTVLQPGKVYFIENMVLPHSCMMFLPRDSKDFKQKLNRSVINAHRMRHYVFQPDNFDDDDLVWDRSEYAETVAEFHESYRENPATFRDMIEIKGYGGSDQTSSVQAGCSKDTDCNGNKICQNSRCVDPSPDNEKQNVNQGDGCTKDVDCPGDLVCENNRCVNQSRNGLSQNSSQQPECTKDVDCPGELVCENNRCVNQSTNGLSRNSSQEPECTKDVDCSGDLVCEDEKCIEPNE